MTLTRAENRCSEAATVMNPRNEAKPKLTSTRVCF